MFPRSIAPFASAAVLAAAGCSTPPIEGARDAPGGEFYEGILIGPTGPLRAHYQLDGDVAVVGGDMLLAAPSRDYGFTMVTPDMLWPGGIVPYDFAPYFPEDASRERVLASIAAWNAHTAETGVSLRPRAGEEDYIVFEPAEHSQAALGNGGGRQPVSIDVEDSSPSPATHEIGHKLGLLHEHQRPDRPIRVIESNIPDYSLSQFAIIETGQVLGPYDVRSVMHYSALGAGIDPTKPWIELDGVAPEDIGGEYLTASDVAAVKAIYAGMDPTTGCLNPCDEYDLTEGACSRFAGGDYRCAADCLARIDVCETAVSCELYCSDLGMADDTCLLLTDDGGDSALACTNKCLVPIDLADCPDPALTLEDD